MTSTEEEWWRQAGKRLHTLDHPGSDQEVQRIRTKTILMKIGRRAKRLYAPNGGITLINEDQQQDQVILALLHDRATLSTIQAVIQVMQNLDATLRASDGVKWFNLLYLMVTKAVYEKLSAPGWADVRWLTQLDIVFARFYFDALANWYTNPALVPRAWMALFESRDRPDILRVQFALAGVNAHINHDLPLAVVQTCQDMQIIPDRGSPEHHDYEAVNGILNEVEPQVLRIIATGIIGEVAEDLNVLGRLLAMWNVQTARDTAWTNAEILWQLRDQPTVRENFLLVLDRMTGLAGRGLLV